MTTTEVQSLYERRPYPHYPLLAKPRWQDGYLGSSLFAAQLAGNDILSGEHRVILSVGSGEILPYILRRWEDVNSKLNCVDLSRRSLKRARLRCMFLRGRTDFIQDDINHWLDTPALHSVQFDHIEAYGVIHHIPALDRSISLLAKHLAPQGTMRIMVYNAGPRNWIWQLNRAFRQMGLHHHNDQDLDTARELLFHLATHSPLLSQHLTSMGSESLANNTRFADTFLHPWEARLPLERWLALFTQKNLEAYALFDRYGELDDLPNPLWKMPTTVQLVDRARDFRFENNLEIWLRHRDHTRVESKSLPPSGIPLRFKTRMPPMQWGKFTETKSLSFKSKYALWRGWLNTIYNQNADDRDVIHLIKRLPRLQAQRLARMGAILPELARAANRYDELLAPITKSVTAPDLPKGIDASQIESLIPKEIKGRRRKVIFARLSRL